MAHGTMLFSTSKVGHLGQILSTGIFGQILSTSLTPPDPNTIEQYGHLIIQALVALVTIWATVRKALQKPEAVVKVPAAAVATVVPAAGAGVTTELPAPDGHAQ